MGKYYHKLTFSQKKTIQLCAIFNELTECEKILEQSNDYLGNPKNFGVNFALNEIRRVNKQQIKRNALEYEESIKEYNIVIFKTVALINEMKLNRNSLAQYLTATTLINGGILSYHGKFRYCNSSNKLFDINGYLGLDVIMGRGCCRHTESLLNSIMTRFGNETHQMHSATNTDSETDHVTSLIRINDSYVGLESLGDQLYFIKRNSQIMAGDDYNQSNPEINGYLRTASNYVSENFINVMEQRNFFDQVTKENKKQNRRIITQFDREREIVHSSLEENGELLEDFHNEITPNINKVYKSLQRKRY